MVSLLLILLLRANIKSITCCADIEWPEEDEALSDNARNTIEALLSSDPPSRPDADGEIAFLR